MSDETQRAPRDPSPERRAARLDRLLLVAHAAAALLAADIAAEVVTEGGLMTWSYRNPGALAIASLSLAFLLASLPWERRSPRRVPVLSAGTDDAPRRGEDDHGSL